MENCSAIKGNEMLISAITWMNLKILCYTKETSPSGAVVKNPPIQCTSPRRCQSTLCVGRSPEAGNSNPLQYSCLEKFHGQRSLVGYSPCGHKESDTTEHTHTKKPAMKDHFLKIISFKLNVKIGQSYIDIVVY